MTLDCIAIGKGHSTCGILGHSISVFLVPVSRSGTVPERFGNVVPVPVPFPFFRRPADAVGHFSCMYNEIVVDAEAVNAAMPNILDAFFVTTNCWRDPRAHLLKLPTNISQLEAVYGQFVKAYPSKAPPILELDCAKLAKNEPPFADASHRLMPAAAV